MSDFLAQKRKEIDERLKELKPLVEEYERLEAAARALTGLDDDGAGARSAPRVRRTTSAGRSSAKAAAQGARKRGRPKGSGTRALQAVQLVEARPGITIPELAEAMGIKQNYLYRVMPALAAEGKVVKSGRGWHVKK
jgi:hypothetical protein